MSMVRMFRLRVVPLQRCEQCCSLRYVVSVYVNLEWSMRTYLYKEHCHTLYGISSVP